MSGKELLRKLEAAGWAQDRIKGSHHILKRGVSRISVPVHGNQDLPKGTLHKLLKEGGLQ